jgi:hypothetical protein
MPRESAVVRLPQAALEALPLAPETRARLAAGLPRTLSLAGWVGPTLFSAPVGPTTLSTLAELAPALRDHRLAHALVVGTIREADGSIGDAHAAYCVAPGATEIRSLDLGEPYAERYVNRGLDELVRAAQAVVAAWEDARSDGLEAPDAEQIRAVLREIDPTSLEDDDAHWPTWIEVVLEAD